MMTRRGVWIGMVIAVAAAVRIWGLGFGLPLALARPDETQIAGPAVNYLSGDFEPQFFQWPTFFSYLVALAYAAYAVLGRPFTGFASLVAFAESRRQSLAAFFYISRGLSAAFGVATVWWIYAIGRRLFDATVGLVAALFLALAFLHVRDSHFGVTDVPMTALVVGAVLLIQRWCDRGGVWPAVAAGFVSGLAGSTKYNGLGVCLAFAVAWILRAADGRGAENREPRARRAAALAIELAAYALAAAVGFFGASPYILLEWSRFRADTGAVESTLAQGHGMVVGQGWWYYAGVILPAAVGWPMFIAGLAGTALLLCTRPRTSLVVLSFPIGYYAFAGRGYAVFARYILPVVPFLCLTAAWLVVSSVRLATSGWPARRRQWMVAAATAAIVAPTAWKTMQLDRLLSTTDNRVIVARAVADLVPPGSVFYQTGESYGQMPLGLGGRDLDVHLATFDPGQGEFAPVDADWVLVQRSPLTLYSAVPESLERVLRERFMLVRRFTTGASPSDGRFYDQQDAFFLPLTQLGGLERPGPEFELYAKRHP